MIDPLFKKGTNVDELADDLVVQHLPEEEKARFAQVMSDWVGREADVIGIMNYAAKQGKAAEYLDRLEQVHKDHVSWIPIVDRRHPEHRDVQRTEAKVERMYIDLGIKPNSSEEE